MIRMLIGRVLERVGDTISRWGERVVAGRAPELADPEPGFQNLWDEAMGVQAAIVDSSRGTHLTPEGMAMLARPARTVAPVVPEPPEGSAAARIARARQARS